MNGPFPEFDFNDLDDDGRMRVRSGSISKTAGLRLESVLDFRVAGIDIVGAVSSECFGLCRMLRSEPGLDLGPGLLKASFAPVEPCRGRRLGGGMALSSENSDESSYPLMIPSHDLHTRIDPGCPNGVPGRREVHFASNI